MSYYKKRKIRDGIKFLESQGFENTEKLDVDRMAEELDVGDIPTELQIKSIVKNLKEKETISYSDPNFRSFQVYQKRGVRFPKVIGEKTEQWKRQKRYLNQRMEEVRIILKEEGFDKLDNFNPETIQRVPTTRQIYDAIDEIKEKVTITTLPPFIEDLERAGVIIPSDIRVKIAAGLSGDTKDEYASLYEDATMGVVDNLQDYFDLAENNPEVVTINGVEVKVSEMQNEIVSYMRNRIVDVPRGDRFLNEFYTQIELVNSMSNNQTIALYGLYDTGIFLNNLTDYDSEGDSINTRGMKQLTDDITTALTF